jgi:lipid A 3-O-deacylase
MHEQKETNPMPEPIFDRANAFCSPFTLQTILQRALRRISALWSVRSTRPTKPLGDTSHHADDKRTSDNASSRRSEYGVTYAARKCRALGAITVLMGSGVLWAADTERRPWEESAISVETGLLWQVGDNTPLSYRLVPTQLSWRSPEVFGTEFLSGRLLVRHRMTMLGTWFQQGPESHYIALAASPSLEWWNPRGNWAAYGGAGGGVGWLDSQGVPGSQGQDFTLNWFARAGIEHVGSHNIRWTAGILFQHLSNGGQTNPNPGIDAFGFTIGWVWSF